MIRLHCPGCDREYKLPDQKAGKTMRCKCGQTFVAKNPDNPLDFTGVSREPSRRSRKTSNSTIWVAVIGGVLLVTSAIVLVVVFTGKEPESGSPDPGGEQQAKNELPPPSSPPNSDVPESGKKPEEDPKPTTSSPPALAIQRASTWIPTLRTAIAKGLNPQSTWPFPDPQVHEVYLQFQEEAFARLSEAERKQTVEAATQFKEWKEGRAEDVSEKDLGLLWNALIRMEIIKEALDRAEKDLACSKLRSLTGCATDFQLIAWGTADKESRRIAVAAAEQAKLTGLAGLSESQRNALYNTGCQDFLEGKMQADALAQERQQEVAEEKRKQDELEAERKRAEEQLEVESREKIAKLPMPDRAQAEAIYRVYLDRGWLNLPTSGQTILRNAGLDVEAMAIKAARADPACHEFRLYTGIETEAQYLAWGFAPRFARDQAMRSLQMARGTIPSRPFYDHLVTLGAKEWMEAGGKPTEKYLEVQREKARQAKIDQEKARIEQEQGRARIKALEEAREREKEQARLNAKAAPYIRAAKRKLDEGDVKEATDRLKEIIQEFPTTEAAEEAKKILKERKLED
jgi:hypothetical protein